LRASRRAAAAPRSQSCDRPHSGPSGAAHTDRVAFRWQEIAMARSNVIPFRKRPPSKGELEAFRRMTRSWSPELRQLMFPRYVAEQNSKPKDQSE